MRTLYPAREPYDHGMLQVDPRHCLYYEQCGNPNGKPVVILHGGPGGGCNAAMRCFHDPARYRIILFDQRGAGRSKPHAELDDNTTWHLVADIERLRTALCIPSWQVFGGSWGSTLALAYAQTHPDRVTELVLRGIFLLRQWEIDWFYQQGASRLFPDAWQQFIAVIPADERDDLLAAFRRRLVSASFEERRAAARAWSVWEGATSFLKQDLDFMRNHEEAEFSLAFARIENHYFVNKGFFAEDGQLLKDAARMAHLPGVIVHGRYDVVCPLQNAWELNAVWPNAQLHIVPTAGHSAFEPETTDVLVTSTDRFAQTT